MKFSKLVNFPERGGWVGPNSKKQGFLDPFLFVAFCPCLVIAKYQSILIFSQIDQTDEDIPQSFMQNFVLKPGNDSFFIQHDVFR